MLKISRHIENTDAHNKEDALLHELEDLQEPQLEDDSECDTVCNDWTLNTVHLFWRLLTAETRKLSFAQPNPMHLYR